MPGPWEAYQDEPEPVAAPAPAPSPQVGLAPAAAQDAGGGVEIDIDKGYTHAPDGSVRTLEPEAIGLAPAAAQATPPAAGAPWAAFGGGQERTPYDDAYATARRDSDKGLPQMHALTNGLTFGLGDVASALGAYMGQLDENNRERSQGIVPKLSAADAFKAKYAAERDSQESWSRDHPWTNLGLTAIGGVGDPLSLLGGEYIGAAPELSSTLLRSAGVGAGTGALNGYTSGRGGLLDGSRVTGAAEGGAAGAAAGVAVPAIGGLFGGGVDAVTGRTAAQTLDQMDAASDAMRKLGTSYDALPAPAQAAVTAGVRKGGFGDDLAVQQAAKSLPIPVPLSRGQITGDPAQQLTENMILRGARGTSASRNAQLFKQDQQAALRGNVNQIGADMSGGFPTTREQAGAAVSDALNAARDQAWGGVGRAYDAARDAPGAAYLSPSSALQLTRSARSALEDTFDPLAVPNVAREVDRLDSALAPWAKQLPPGVNPDRVSGLSGTNPADVRSIFDARARLTALQTDPRSPEYAAASAVKGALDKHVDQALTDDLFSGDPASVGLWRKAIGARRDFGQTFEAGDLIQKLTTRQPGGEADLRVDPHDAANYIFGRSAIGWVGRQNLYRGLTRVRATLGADSPAWNQLRSAAFGQIAKAGDGPMEAGTQQFSGAGFAQAWRKAKGEDQALVSTLFTPDERATIDRFAGIAARATKPVTGGDNASNSGITAARAFKAMRRLPFVTIESIPFIDHFADKIDNAAAVRTIRQATYGARARQTPPPLAARASERVVPPLTATLPLLLPRRPDQDQ